MKHCTNVYGKKSDISATFFIGKQKVCLKLPRGFHVYLISIEPIHLTTSGMMLEKLIFILIIRCCDNGQGKKGLRWAMGINSLTAVMNAVQRQLVGRVDFCTWFWRIQSRMQWRLGFRNKAASRTVCSHVSNTQTLTLALSYFLPFYSVGTSACGMMLFTLVSFYPSSAFLQMLILL